MLCFLINQNVVCSDLEEISDCSKFVFGIIQGIPSEFFTKKHAKNLLKTALALRFQLKKHSEISETIVTKIAELFPDLAVKVCRVRVNRSFVKTMSSRKSFPKSPF